MIGSVRAALDNEMSPSWIDILDVHDTRGIGKRVMRAMNFASGDDEMLDARDPLRWSAIVSPNGRTISSRSATHQRQTRPPSPGPIATGFQWMCSACAARALSMLNISRLFVTPTRRTLETCCCGPLRATMHDAAYRERRSGRFDRVLTGEYQDVNRAQFMRLRYLCRPALGSIADYESRRCAVRGAKYRVLVSVRR